MDYNVFRDIFLIIRVIAIISILILAYQTGKKVKEYKFLSATTGFTIFLISFSFFHLGTGLVHFYSDYDFLIIFDSFGTYSFVFGMFLFVILTEIDEKKHLIRKRKGFSYPLTLINLIGLGILLPITIVFPLSTIFIFVFEVFPFVICVYIFTKRFNDLKIVKQSRPLEWFMVGISLAGFSNFLYNQITVSLLGPYLILGLNSFFVIVGALMMTNGWNKLPSLKEFDWISKMERLLIVHLETSIMLFEYNFRINGQTESDPEVDGDLAGSAISGINMLLKEILSSKGHIKQIDHEDKKIYFTHGEETASIIITTGDSEEYKYRLELFELEFEKKYGVENLKQFDGDLSLLEDIESLIVKHFL